MRRIFLAINLPETAKEKIYLAISQFKFANARWVRKEGIHITLLFLGYLENNEILDLIDVLKQVKSEPFQIRINYAHFGPDSKKPKFIWATVEPNNRLELLQKQIERLLRDKIRYKHEKRGFTPHLTLGRLKSGQKFSASQKQTQTSLDLTINVKSFEIMESFLSPHGAQYQPVKSFALEGQESAA